MLLVDVTIVQVALPTIQRSFRASFADLQWVIDAYALVLSALILSWGSIADRYGRKRVFLAGVAVFSVASFLCGIAGSSTTLVAARALQGTGGAAMFATGLALIGQDFQGRDLPRALSIWGATVGGAVAAGPLLGGLITQAVSWRWVFFVNVPIGAVALAISASKTSNVSDPGAKRLDFVGLITFSGSLFLLVLALVRGNDDGWASGPIVALLVGAALLMCAFIAAEVRQRRPMFDLSLFGNRAFTGVSLATFAIGSGMFAAFPYITFYFQNALGYSPLAGGVRLLPSTLMAFAVPLVFPRLAQRVPVGWLLAAGLALSGAGMVMMSGLSFRSGWTALLAGLVVSGVGVGLANPSIGRIALSVVPRERSGMASGISNTFRIAGLATGVAALGALFQSGLRSSLSAQVGKASGGLARALASRGVRATASARAPARSLLSAYAAGTNDLLHVGAVVVLAGAALAIVLVRRGSVAPFGAVAAAPAELPEAARAR